MSFYDKMTAIANKIRSLLSITNTMGLDAMATNLETVINTCDTQASIIALIEAALEGKAGSNSGDTSLSFDYKTVTPSDQSELISFTGLIDKPKMFWIMPTDTYPSLWRNPLVVNVVYVNEQIRGVYTTYEYFYSSSSGFGQSYNNGTLTINANANGDGGYFASSIPYSLIYAV